MHMHRVSTPRERSPAKQECISRQIREFSGVFIRHWQLTGYTKRQVRTSFSTSPKSPFRMSEKAFPRRQTGFSKTRQRLFRSAKPAFMSRHTPHSTPKNSFCDVVNGIFTHIMTPLSDIPFSVSRFSTVKIFYFRFCIFMHKTDCARLPESRFSLPLPASFHTWHNVVLYVYHPK